MSESPLAPPTPPSKRTLFIALGAALAACVVVGLFVAKEMRGPRGPGAPPPPMTLSVNLDPGAPPLAEGSTLPASGRLTAHVHLAGPARVSLVHVDPGHGMEALLLNLPLGPGDHPLGADGGALGLDLRDLSGPQVLAAVASERDLVQDEALSAARGLAVKNASVSAFHFTVGP